MYVISVSLPIMAHGYFPVIASGELKSKFIKNTLKNNNDNS